MSLLKMGKIWIISMAAIVGIVLSSCDLLGSDENDSPKVNSISVASDLGAQGSATVKGDIKDDNSGVSVSMVVMDADGKDVTSHFSINFTQVASDKKKWDLESDGKASIAIKDSACKGDYELVVTATDADGATGSNKASFKVTDGGSKCSTNPAGTAASTTTITAGSNGHATLGSSIDLDAGKAYLMSEAASKVSDLDICYSYSGTENTDKIFSPKHAKASGFTYAASWSSPPETQFYKTSKTAAEFAAITTKEEITAIWDASKASKTSLPAAANDVFIVKTTAGALALVLIESQTSGKTGSITIKSTL